MISSLLKKNRLPEVGYRNISQTWPLMTLEISTLLRMLSFWQPHTVRWFCDSTQNLSERVSNQKDNSPVWLNSISLILPSSSANLSQVISSEQFYFSTMTISILVDSWQQMNLSQIQDQQITGIFLTSEPSSILYSQIRPLDEAIQILRIRCMLIATNYSSSSSGRIVANREALLTSRILAQWLVTTMMDEQYALKEVPISLLVPSPTANKLRFYLPDRAISFYRSALELVLTLKNYISLEYRTRQGLPFRINKPSASFSITSTCMHSNFQGFHTLIILRSSIETNYPFRVNRALTISPMCPFSSPAKGLDREREGSQRNNSEVNIHEHIQEILPLLQVARPFTPFLASVQLLISFLASSSIISRPLVCQSLMVPSREAVQMVKGEDISLTAVRGCQWGLKCSLVLIVALLGDGKICRVELTLQRAHSLWMGRQYMSTYEPVDLITPIVLWISPSQMKHKLRLLMSTPNNLSSSEQSRDKTLLKSTLSNRNTFFSYSIQESQGYCWWQSINYSLLSRVTRPMRPFLWISIIFFIACFRYLEDQENAGKRIFLSCCRVPLPLLSASVERAAHADQERNSKNSDHSMVLLPSTSISSKRRVNSQLMSWSQCQPSMALRRSQMNFSRSRWLSLMRNSCLIASMLWLLSDMMTLRRSQRQLGLLVSFSLSCRYWMSRGSYIRFFTLSFIAVKQHITNRASEVGYLFYAKYETKAGFQYSQIFIVILKPANQLRSP